MSSASSSLMFGYLGLASQPQVNHHFGVFTEIKTDQYVDVVSCCDSELAVL